MNRKKVLSLSTVIIIILSASIVFYPSIVADQMPCTVYGYIYVDEIIMKPDEAILSFPTQDIEATLYPDGYYIVDFAEDVGKTGIFLVTINGETYTADETITVQYGVYAYEIDLHVTTINPNNPPNKPTTPSPENNSENIDINPYLSVNVTDPDDDTMNVSFYNAFDDSLIDTDLDVVSGGTATVQWTGLSLNTTYTWYAIANDSEYDNKSDIWNFTTMEKVNNPPDMPSNPSPGDNAQDVDLNPTLYVDVSDPDDDTMSVSFYDALDDSLIDTDLDVVSGGTATVQWTGLSYNTQYSWYAIANDSELETKSGTWSFTTKEKKNEPPKVKITKPENALYIFNLRIRKYLLRFRIPLIIGKITIIANATDEDSGIERVDFYINGELMGNDTDEPYTYLWKRDRIRLIHLFKIKVIAYDNEGATAEDCKIVRKFL